MIPKPTPPKGHMYLYDSINPPLADGSYRLTAETDVSAADVHPTFSQHHYFDVVGPRFAIPPSLVAGCFPPSNGHGAFQDSLPHIVLGRRTLPWERPLASPPSAIPTPKVKSGDPPLVPGPVPWMALLLFEENEYTLWRNKSLEWVVPPQVYDRLGKPAGVICDAVEADKDLILAILPSVEELKLLAHARQVNVDDRELNAYGGDGFFSVVVSNRLPSPQAQCCAVLVSLEERLDLMQSLADPPPVADQSPKSLPGHPVANPSPVAGRAAALPVAGPAVSHYTEAARPAVFSGPEVSQALGQSTTAFTLSHAPRHTFGTGSDAYVGPVADGSVRLVALTSWKFTCEGPGTFRDLMHGLVNSDSMFGSVAIPGHPALTDTGHIQLALQDRVGAGEQVWYRGPLVPYNLTRDSLGPYHSADQARRVTPDTGAEDISYAAAFEVGRLLAVADPRMAQALMTWRRESYRQSARASTIAEVAEKMTLALPAAEQDTLHTPIVPIVASAATQVVVESKPPIADAYGLETVANAPGMNPALLAAAWNLPSTAAAASLLGGDPGTLGTVVSTPAQTVRGDTTIAAVAADTSGLDRLSSARTRAVENAVIQLGGS